MRKALKLSFLLSVLLPCVGCDQATKSVARKFLTTSDPIPLLNGFIRFEYVENAGAFLGMGSQLPEVFRFLIFVVFTGTMLAVMLVIKVRDGDLPQLTGLALLAGGGVGNLIDRIINEGRVVDFVSLGLGPVRTGTFNVADVAVMAGATLLLYCLIRHQGKSPGAV
jgi:signal peptidase II